MYLESNTPSAVIKSQEIDGLEEWPKKEQAYGNSSRCFIG